MFDFLFQEKNGLVEGKSKCEKELGETGREVQVKCLAKRKKIKKKKWINGNFG